MDEWLVSIKLDRYAAEIKEEGYDELEFLGPRYPGKRTLVSLAILHTTLCIRRKYVVLRSNEVVGCPGVQRQQRFPSQIGFACRHRSFGAQPRKGPF